MARQGIRTTAAVLGAAALLITGCSSKDNGDNLITIDPATAAISPAMSNSPAGVVHPYPGQIASVSVDPATGSAVVVSQNPQRIVVVAPADLRADSAPTGREITVDGDVHGVSIGAPGTALLALDRRVVELALDSGEQTSIAVDGRANTAAELPDGRIAIGTDDGSIHVVDSAGNQSETVTGLASTDALAVTGNELSALDRRQTSLTSIDLDADKLGVALRAGEGAAQLTTDRFGRILVTDTTGDELLVFTADPLLMHQRYPVGAAPYAVAYDETADRVWVTLTGTNEVVGYDLSSGIPVETARFQTVRQPNSLAVDNATGNLIVGSATGDGLQVIPSRTS